MFHFILSQQYRIFIIIKIPRPKICNKQNGLKATRAFFYIYLYTMYHPQLNLAWLFLCFVVLLVTTVDMATVPGNKDRYKISIYPGNSFFTLLTEYISFDVSHYCLLKVNLSSNLNNASTCIYVSTYTW